MKVNQFFYSVLGIFVASALLVLALLALLVTTTGPRVRSVTFLSNAYQEPAADNQLVTFSFNRPLQKGDYTHSVTIRPQAEYRVVQQGQRLAVIFTNNLSQLTKYTIQLSDSIRDSDGKKMSSPYIYHLATASGRLWYVKRSTDGDDTLVSYSMQTRQETTVITAPKIKFFAFNNGYVVIDEQKDATGDQVVLLNRQTHKQTTLTGIHDMVLYELHMAADAPLIAFIARNTYYSTSLELYTYDLNKQQLHFWDESVLSTLVPNGGQFLVYKNNEDLTYVTNTIDATRSPTLLGRFSTLGSFNQANDKLLLENASGVQMYDAKNGKTTPVTGLDGTISALSFLHTSEAILYQDDRIAADGTDSSSIETVLNGHIITSFAAAPWKKFIGSPQASIDDRYIVIESAGINAQYDDYMTNAKPYNTELIIFDRHTNQRLPITLTGVDPAWE